MGSNWDYALAQGMVQRMQRSLGGAAPTMLEGKIASTAPLTVSLCGGEVMAPPLKLDCVAGAQGFYEDQTTHHLKLEKWAVGDKVVCCIVGNTVVILGRLGGTAWTVPVR